MKTTGTALANILYIICSIIFYLLIVAFGFTVAAEAFTDDGKIGAFSSKTHSSFGYQIPVELNVKPKNPMFNNMLYNNYKEYVDDNGRKTYNWVLEYENSITQEDSLNYKTVIGINNYGLENNFELTSSIFKGDGYVHVKPKTVFNKAVLVFKTYVNSILLIVIFFFLKNIFKMLIMNIKFSQKLYRFIQILGIIMILKVFVSSISNSILGKDIPYVGIFPLNNSLKYVDITMNPGLDFDFTLLLVGLSLVILSVLLREGSIMQQENDLTI